MSNILQAFKIGQALAYTKVALDQEETSSILSDTSKLTAVLGIMAENASDVEQEDTDNNLSTTERASMSSWGDKLDISSSDSDEVR